MTPPTFHLCIKCKADTEVFLFALLSGMRSGNMPRQLLSERDKSALHSTKRDVLKYIDQALWLKTAPDYCAF